MVPLGKSGIDEGGFNAISRRQERKNKEGYQNNSLPVNEDKGSADKHQRFKQD